ncbi:MAG TPA: hypothetical protein VFS00_13290 [Polyangiaceae bacterium]|nr:hypothetical protein [Polyangiaceae bacterium]
MSAKDENPSSGEAGKRTVRATPAAKAADRANAYAIPPGHAWSKLWMVWAGVAAVGAALSVVGYGADPKRFAFTYLAAFAWGLTVCLGGLFFVLLQHLTGAGWSVVVRRGAEQLMGALPVFAVFVLPILFVFRETLYPWAGHAAHEPIIMAKHGYLNVPFWLVRAAVYFAIWLFFSYQLFALSRRQDETGDPKLTLKATALSAPGMLLFALSLTFAGIDWLMSLEPEWFSTMFGVYLFAGSVISIMAFECLLYSRMVGAGLLAKEVNTHHFHDLGKLLFAFTVFWAYISFSQYFLIWYANIPEETDFFHHRQQGGWGWVGIALVFGHFFGPFFLLLSRHAKRFPGSLQFGAVVILAMHYVDLYWLVMPNVDHHVHPSPFDLGPLLLVAGAMLAVTFRRMLAAPVLPVRDPRLDRSLDFENALGSHGTRDRRAQKPAHLRHRRRQHRHAGGRALRAAKLLLRRARRRAARQDPRPPQRRARPAARQREAPAYDVRQARPRREARAHPHRRRDGAARAPRPRRLPQHPPRGGRRRGRRLGPRRLGPRWLGPRPRRQRYPPRGLGLGHAGSRRLGPRPRPGSRRRLGPRPRARRSRRSWRSSRSFQSPRARGRSLGFGPRRP